MKEVFDSIKAIAASDCRVAVIVAGVIVFVLWVYGKIVRMTAKHDSFENVCADLRTRLLSVERDISEIKVDMTYVKTTLNTIMNTLVSMRVAPITRPRA